MYRQRSHVRLAGRRVCSSVRPPGALNQLLIKAGLPPRPDRYLLFTTRFEDKGNNVPNNTFHLQQIVSFQPLMHGVLLLHLTLAVLFSELNLDRAYSLLTL